MKIGDIIKQTLVERRIISEEETGQQTKSYDLNNPQQVLDAALANGCPTQWKISPKDLRSRVKVDRNYTITGESGQTIVVPKGTNSIQDAGNGDYFLGNKFSEDGDNTYFWGFSPNGEGFRWKCDALRSVDQAGTRNVTPAQQKLLDDFLSTYGGVYTQIGGKGMVAKDIRELKYEDGRSIWDKNTGIPVEGNYVYVQNALYNVKPNQLAGIAKNLDSKGWTLTEPLMDTPEYNSKRRMIDLFPDLGVTSDVMIYPKDASKIASVTTDRRLNKTKSKLNKEVCRPAVQFLAKCINSSGRSSGCKDSYKVNDNKLTAAECYLATESNPQFKGILGLGDELSMIYNNTKQTIFGIGKEVDQIQRNIQGAKNKPQSSVNEGSLVSTIKNHLLENIRNKNSQL